MSPKAQKRSNFRMAYGIATVLGEDCKIYYENLFSVKHVGRVSDLLVAKLKRDELDEMRLRALLLFGIFEAYRAQVGSEPVGIECGINKDRLAVGVSFRDPGDFAGGKPLNPAGMANRIKTRQPEGSFEALLTEIYAQSDALTIRVGARRRVEVVAQLVLSVLPQNKTDPEVITMDQHAATTPAQATSYTQLGDLDYPKLLRDEGKVTDYGGDRTARVVRGTTDRQANEVIRVAGSKAEESDNETIVVGGTNTSVDDSALAEKLEQYESKIRTLEKQLAAAKTAQKKSDSKHSGGHKTSIFETLMKKTGLIENEDANNEYDDEKIIIKGSSESEDASEPEFTIASGIPSRDENEGVVEELDQTISKAAQESGDILKDEQNVRTRRWVDGLLSDLTKEKAKLFELSKSLHNTLRQKEAAFHNQETLLREEIHRKDDALRQKDAIIIRLKDQNTDLTMKLERAKASAQTANEAMRLKQKLDMTTRLLQRAKQESTAMTAKLDDLRGQLTAAQAAPRNATGPSQTEYSAVKIRCERAERQLEELKRANKQIADKLAESKRERTVTGGEREDLKKKLDAAVRDASSHERDAGQLRLQVEELKRENTRLSVELKTATKKAA